MKRASLSLSPTPQPQVLNATSFHANPSETESLPTPEKPISDDMSLLHKEPSFSVFNDPSSDGSASEVLERTVTVGESIEREFSFHKKPNMGLIEEESEEERVQDQLFNGGSDPLCLATGIEGLSLRSDLDEESDVEEHCKKMVQLCPFHPLFLKNYAQILQSKGDLHGAEEYYSRASSADPEDGETWMQYAKLVWNLHRDKDRALSFFEFATRVAPEDSNILAAHASFLWEIEDGEEEDGTSRDHLQVEQKGTVDELDIPFPTKDRASIEDGIGSDVPDSITHGSGNPENREDYYRKIIDQNPNNALFLGNYAKFLYETKGDLQGAEEYYSRAVLADPGNGEVMARYAKLVWDLHHDHHKATIYFERAVQASPGNSHVLAAHASFLWEIDDDEDDEPSSRSLQSS